jgi:hypothetical protein
MRWGEVAMHRAKRGRRTLMVLGALSALVVAGCGEDATSATGRERAEQLVAATEAAGVAPGLTVDAAEALYGDDAPAVCRAFDGGTSSAADVALRGHLANRRKVITTDAIIYGRLVVQTYCPDVLGDYDAVVDELDPFEVTGRSDR